MSARLRPRPIAQAPAQPSMASRQRFLPSSCPRNRFFNRRLYGPRRWPHQRNYIMELIINSKESVTNFVKWANKSKSAEEIAEPIGELDREAYFSLLEDWKACLHELVEGVRIARVM